MKPTLVDMLPDSPQRVDGWLARAYALRHEDAAAALALNEAAHAMALRLNYAPGVAYGLLRIAWGRLVAADDDEPCLAQLQQAAAAMVALDDARGEAEALNLQAHLHSRRNEHGRAIELYTRCVELRRKLGDRAGESGALNNVAVALRATHRHADALELLFASFGIGEEINDDACRAYALCNIGHVLAATGDPHAATDHFERALALTSRTRDRALESTVRLGLGTALAALGREPLALAHLSQAVRLARRTGNRGDLIDALAALGDTQQQFGRLDEARQALDEALQSLRPLPDRDTACRVYCALGRHHRLRGESEAALARLQQALQAAHAAGSESGAAQVHQLLAAVHEEAGDYAAALDHFRRCREAEQRIDGREVRRRIRAVLTQAELGEARRDAEDQQRRAHALAHALDQARSSARRQQERYAHLRQQAELLATLAREDLLSSDASRRWLDLCLARECERAGRPALPLSLALFEVEGYPALVESHGPEVGEAVLHQIAQRLRSGCRSADLCGRYGGYAFLLILSDTAAAQAASLCGKLRQSVEAFEGTGSLAGLGRIGLRMGLASAEQAPQAEALLAAARRHLEQDRFAAEADGPGALLPDRRKMMRTVLCGLLLTLLVCLPGAAGADAAPPEAVRELRFARGHSSVTVRAAVLRGERHYWRFSARAGQATHVSVSALEKNAVLQLWQPGARPPVAPDGDIEGTSMPGAGPDDDAQVWEGTLPQSGSFLVVVGATRGNASYKLTLRIGH